MQNRMTDTLASAGYAAGAAGVGIGGWMQTHWLQVLSGIGVLLTVYFQYAQHKREQRRLEILEQGNCNDVD